MQIIVDNNAKTIIELAIKITEYFIFFLIISFLDKIVIYTTVIRKPDTKLIINEVITEIMLKIIILQILEFSFLLLSIAFTKPANAIIYNGIEITVGATDVNGHKP